MLAEFEVTDCPLRPWSRHFRAVTLGDATDVIAPQYPLLRAVYVQEIKLIPIIRVLAGVVFFLAYRDPW